MVRWISILLAVAGLTLGFYAVGTAFQAPPELPLSRPPSINPFGRGVSALGKVETASREINIAAPQAALVTEVLVDVGDRVNAGQVLMQLDARPIEADLIRAAAQEKAAEAEIERWRALPRAEDVPPLEAAVSRARAVLADRQEQYSLTQDAEKSGAATSRDVSAARFAFEQAKASMAQAEADLAKLKAGGWQPDLIIAQAALARAQAEVRALTVLRERMTVRAPRAATVLRRQVEPGEFATTDSTRPALILGDLERINIRAEIDEEDIGLVTAKSKAVARMRGAVVEQFDLELVRIEPFARPKTDLTGANLERVDTRVVDVVYAVKGKPATPLYPGQAVDVYVDLGEGVTPARRPPGG